VKRFVSGCLRGIVFVAVLRAGCAGAEVIDFEPAVDGPRNPALRSASHAYESLGVSFTGGGDFPGQPLFRAWTSLSRFVAQRPPADNQFFITTFNRSGDDAFFDIDVLFAKPAAHAEGDLVFNPLVDALAAAFDSRGREIGEQWFDGGGRSWIGGHFDFESSAGISRILLRTDSQFAQVGLDNLAFAPVPEPSAALWLLVGAGLLLAARRRLDDLR
jgi:hypothetical protein